MMYKLFMINCFLFVSIIATICYGDNNEDKRNIKKTQGIITIIAKDKNYNYEATLISEYIMVTTAAALISRGKYYGKMVNDESRDKSAAHMKVFHYGFDYNKIYKNNFGILIFKDSFINDQELTVPATLIEPHEKINAHPSTCITNFKTKNSFYISYMRLKTCKLSITSKQLLCYGVADGTVNCRAGEGGALFIKVKREEELYVFAGIIIKDEPVCNEDTIVYVLRINIHKVFNWIQSFQPIN